MQSRRHSLLEVLLSTAIGYCVAFTTNLLVIPAFGHALTAADNFWITNIFTLVSIVRQYAVRRLFNLLHTKGLL